MDQILGVPEYVGVRNVIACVPAFASQPPSQDLRLFDKLWIEYHSYVEQGSPSMTSTMLIKATMCSPTTSTEEPPQFKPCSI